MHKFIFFLLLFLIAACKSSTEKAAAPEERKMVKSLDLYLPEDLEATLWAASPMFYNPTNMDVDIRGRIWITEAVNYRTFNNDSAKNLHHTQGDRVMILEDKDGDGRADTSKVFVQDKDLIAPVGIAVIGNKVVVSCSPNLIVYTDENGDDQPDKKEVLLTGFGGKDHDHSLHSVTAGPDGGWYFNVGNAGPHKVQDKSGWNLRSGSIYTGGSPHNKENSGNLKSDDGKVWVGGLALKINPDGTGMKVMGHNFRNAFEVVPDSYGNLWQNDNDDQVTTCRTTWLMEGGNAGFFSTDGTRYWQADQRPGQDIFSAHWHQDDPGVMPAGDRTGSGSPTGVVRNESDALGKEYSGMLLSADAGRNVIFGYHPSVQGSGYHLGKKIHFIASVSGEDETYVWNDSAQNSRRESWFRPSDITIGTDGALYIADWYDPVVGGHQMQDSTGFGRIYRIAPKGKKLIAPKIDLTTTEGQVDALKSPAINVRNIGFALLKAKGEAAIPAVKSLLQNDNPFVQARAVWLLAQLGEAGKKEVEKMLLHDEEQLRATAYRALRQTAKDILPYAQKKVADPSPFVRREVAVSLRDLPYGQIKPLLLKLAAQFDGKDRWYLETLGACVQGHEGDFYAEAKRLFNAGANPTQWSGPMAALAWRLHPPEATTELAQRATAQNLPLTERKAALTALAFIHTKEAAQAMLAIAKSGPQEVAEGANYWLSFRQTNDWASLIDWSKMNLNTVYQRKLAQMKVKQGIVLDEHQSLDERRWRITEMAGDSVGGLMVIGMAEQKILPKDLVTFVAAKIKDNPDATVRMQARTYFGAANENKTFSAQNILQLKGDAAKGKAVFASRCAACHKLGSSGGAIGPDLTGIEKKFDHAALIDAIINPSAAIVFGYEPWLITTKDGETVYGFLLSENKQSIVLKDMGGQKHVIQTGNIATRKKESKSLMPDPAGMGITEQDVAHVAGFLKAQNTGKR